MNKWIALVCLLLSSVSAHAAGYYTLTVVNTYNPFSPTGTAVISGPVPTAGTATVDAGGNVAATGVQFSFRNVSSEYNYTNGVWSAVVGGNSVTHSETCIETAGLPCTGVLAGFTGIWNNTQQNGGAPTSTCAASAFFAAGNCDRLSVVEVPGVSLTIIEQSEFAIPALTAGYLYRFAFAGPRCTDFAVQLGQDSSSNTIVTPARCVGFPGAVTLSVFTPPVHGTASVVGANIVYTPNGGYLGADTLIYQGTDGTATSNGIVSINVADVTPNSFGFNSQPNVLLNALVTSNSIAITGITVPVAISIAGGTYAINGGAFTAAAGTIANGNTVAVRHVSAGVVSGTVLTTLTIGGVTGQFSSTTVAVDPDTDGDGVPDAADNCTLASNASQLDADGDSFGNLCDADLNNSGLVTSADFALFRTVLGQPASAGAIAAAADLNGSGTVTTADFGLLRVNLGSAPGPKGTLP